MSKLSRLVTLAASALLMAPIVGSSGDVPTSAEIGRVPESLKKNADCMFEVLKAMPGVREPSIGYVTRQGWTHPYLEYRATEANSWVQPTRFEAQRGDHGNYTFLAILPGVLPHGASGLDNHVTFALMGKWKATCGVTVNAITV